MTKNLKTSQLSRQRSEYLDAVENCDLNLLQSYIQTGQTGNLPDEIVIYLELLELVRSLYNKYETKNIIVNTLMSPVYGLSRHFALKIYFDSLNFFYADNDVKQKAWEKIYADHLDNLAYYALEKDDLETARRCFLDAAKFRGVGREEKSEIPAEMLNKPIVIYSIDPARAGIPQASRRELAEFIDNLPEISERERIRVKRDAGVIETTLFEDIVNVAEDNKN